MKSALRRLYWILSMQAGFDPRAAFRSLRGLPGFLRDLRRFRSQYSGPIVLRPCLQDRYEEGGATKNEYFRQDLLVAREIFEAAPDRHVDIGSRVDGFVAHVASFREIEVFDVRPVSDSTPGITFRKADFMNPVAGSLEGCCDSLSCLHALEHFGLGRYGDPIDVIGHERGISNMARLLSPGGVFYLSVPVGRARVEFNANRVFDPAEIVRLAAANLLSLKSFSTIDENGIVADYMPGEAPFHELAEKPYTLGIFRFIKG